MKKNILTAIGTFLAGIVVAIGGMVMANPGEISVNGVPMTPENTVVTTDENGTSHADIKKEEVPAEPEDPLPIIETQATDTTPTNCVQ